MSEFRGNRDVREFYDRIGWQQEGGKPVDTELFGVREDGPIRIALHAEVRNGIREALAPNRKIETLLELGCGGNPALDLVDLADRYQGVDFSREGLALADRRLAGADADFDLQQADITKLPFADDSFDAVYCAHVLYHIDTRAGQEAALNEALRVLRPGGTAVLLLANPFPLLFPVRLLRRGLAAILRRGGGGPLPYLPLRPAWYAAHARKRGDVELRTAGIASTWFNQNVSEFKPIGRSLWRGLARLQTRFPQASVSLGNYFMLIVRKHPNPGR